MTQITQVSCGANHTAALRANGAVLTWGSNENGQLDQDGRRALQLPSPISALEELPLVAVSAGKRHAVVITAHGSAFSWG
ncbi:predicted protein, partial [Phaeodactylum tricornutum CCAP 1055/1]